MRQKTVAEECPLPTPTDVVAALRRSRESQKYRHTALLHILFDPPLTRTAGTLSNRMGPASWARMDGFGGAGTHDR